MTLEDLQNYKHGEPSLKPNYNRIPVTQFNLNKDGIEKFNEIYQLVKNDPDFHKFELTKGGYIPKWSTGKWQFPAYHIHHTMNNVVELIILEKGQWRFQCRGGIGKEEENNISGAQAFKILKKRLLKDGIDLNNYAIDNGIEIKQEIESPMICMAWDGFCNDEIKDAHHIDFHSSYPAGLANTHPEFYKTMKYFYDNRKKDPINKAVLNKALGCFQSVKLCKAKWAHLSKDFIKDNNDRIRNMAERLRKNKNIILAYNTDGIWYIGDVYHGEGEGDDLGQWSNDHVNCKIRFKSAGAYEFKENGKYHAVVRGHTRLDESKPRDQWSWGDIYQADATPIIYVYNEEYGIVEADDGE